MQAAAILPNIKDTRDQNRIRLWGRESLTSSLNRHVCFLIWCWSVQGDIKVRGCYWCLNGSIGTSEAVNTRRARQERENLWSLETWSRLSMCSYGRPIVPPLLSGRDYNRCCPTGFLWPCFPFSFPFVFSMWPTWKSQASLSKLPEAKGAGAFFSRFEISFVRPASSTFLVLFLQRGNQSQTNSELLVS